MIVKKSLKKRDFNQIKIENNKLEKIKDSKVDKYTPTF